MSGKYIKKKGSRNYENYNQEDLAKAVATLRNKKIAARNGEEVFGIPKSTIDNAVKEKFTNAFGGQTRFMPEFEKMLVELIDTFVNQRLLLDKLDMRMIVKEYLNHKNVKGNFPGVDWVNGFIKRHDLLIMSR